MMINYISNIVEKIIFTIVILFSITCNTSTSSQLINNSTFIYILGVAQDGGYPQAGCLKQCCVRVINKPYLQRMVTSIAIVDNIKNQCWIFDATPDFPQQLHLINEITDSSNPVKIAGVFLTHAHIGHYTGLIHLGHEVMGAKNIPVYTMPRMTNFINNNGPWNQLITKNNIQIDTITDESVINISDQISIIPFSVPHRDEFSETVGYQIKGPNNSILFIPDIDKWNLWDKNIITEVNSNDYLLLDGTFYNGNELPERDMSEIPHPFVVESMELFKQIPKVEKNKIHFIHFNHTNPLNNPKSNEFNLLINKGFNVANQGQIFKL